MQFHLDTNQTIAPKEMVSTGAYFRHAIDWYQEIFLLPFINIITYVIFLSLYLVGLGLAGWFAVNMFPLKTKKTIIFEANRDNYGTITTMESLRRYDNPIQNILMKSIEHYVLIRESYILDGVGGALNLLAKKQEFVQENSSSAVFNQYKAWLNRYSDITEDLILSGTEIRARILSFDFVMTKKTFWQKWYDYFAPTHYPTIAKIDFVTTNSNSNQRFWRVLISYRFRLVGKTPNTGATIDFKVVDYNIQALD